MSEQTEEERYELSSLLEDESEVRCEELGCDKEEGRASTGGREDGGEDGEDGKSPLLLEGKEREEDELSIVFLFSYEKRNLSEDNKPKFHKLRF